MNPTTRVAITLAFDAQAEAAVRLFWQQLAAQDIPVPGLASGYRPHITLSVYDTDDLEFYRAALIPFAAKLKPFSLRLDVLGIFPERGVLFLTPRMTYALMDVQRTAIDAFGANPIAMHLLPERWTPHCTLAIPASAEQLAQAVLICQQGWQPIDAEIIGAGIQIVPESQDRWYAHFQT